MPITSPFKLLQVLDTRCRKNSTGLPVNKSIVDEWTGIGFKISGIPLLTKTDEVTEILPPPETIRVPGVKHWVKGLANVRGSLMPIIDMNSYLFGRDTELHKHCRVLIINRMGLVAGLLVDEVYGLRRFKPDECRDEIDSDAGPVRDYITGIFIDRLQRWNVFSVDKLVHTEHFVRVV